MRKATGPIRPLVWREMTRGQYMAAAPELGDAGLYRLRTAADGVVVNWEAGYSGHGSYGGQIGTWRFEDFAGGKAEAIEHAFHEIEKHFTDRVETAIARMRGLA